MTPMKIFACLAFAALPAFAQTLAFEVASVKPAPPPTGPGIRVSVNDDDGRLTMNNIALRNIVIKAYELKEQQVEAPDWMSNTRFDIVAKFPVGATKKQIPEMLRALLAERFKLTTHKSSKAMPVYALIPAKAGPKLKPAEGDDDVNVSGSAKGVQMKGKMALAGFAESLSAMLDRPVLDLTGLKGVYEVDLTWSRNDSAAASGDSSDAPTIFTAIQESMGLKLEARRAPMDVIVVDHAEKVPTEN